MLPLGVGKLIWHYYLTQRPIAVVIIANIDENRQKIDQELFDRALLSVLGQSVLPDYIFISYSGITPIVKYKISHTLFHVKSLNNNNELPFIDYLLAILHYSKNNYILIFLQYTDIYFKDKIKIIKKLFKNDIECVIHDYFTIDYSMNKFDKNITDNYVLSRNDLYPLYEHTYESPVYNLAVLRETLNKCNMENDIDIIIKNNKKEWSQDIIIKLRNKFVYNGQYIRIHKPLIASRCMVGIMPPIWFGFQRPKLKFRSYRDNEEDNDDDDNDNDDNNDDDNN